MPLQGRLDGARVEDTAAALGDARLSTRMRAILSALEKNPDASFPQAMKDSASLEAFYRFINNPRVKPEAVMAPHVETTLQRAREVLRVVAIHDTTEIEPPGASVSGGFYDLQKGRCGFLAHFTMLVSADEPCPLGIAGFSIVARTPKPPQNSRARWEDDTKESRRWWHCADRVAEQVGATCDVTHVMDREADSYEIFSMLQRNGHSFVIRVHHDRKATSGTDPIGKLSDVMSAQPVVLSRDVHVSSRKATTLPKKGRAHPARASRTAQLEVRAAAVTLQRPLSLPTHDLPATLAVNVVFVDEPNPPEGADPVRWKLFTTMPIETPQQIGAVIDIYRGRWLIEEYFKAVKTGCAFEKRPLELLKTCSTALALFVPIAMQMLQLRFIARSAPTAPASTVFSKDQIAAVRRLAASDRRLPPRPSVQHVMLAVAGFGGHIKSNGDPGWQVLGRGYLQLCELLFDSPIDRWGSSARM